MVPDSLVVEYQIVCSQVMMLELNTTLLFSYINFSTAVGGKLQHQNV